MAKTCIKPKVVDHDTRKAYKVRKRSSRIQRKNKDGILLNSLELELYNRTTKQTWRWIMHVKESLNRGGMSFGIEQELRAHTRKPYEEREKTRLPSEPELSPQAGEFWRSLQDQRKAAMAAQGQSFEAVDWWVRKSGGGGCNRERARKEKLKKAIHSLSARMKELGVECDEAQMNDRGVVDDDEEGESGCEGLKPQQPVATNCDERNEHGGDMQMAGPYSPAMPSPVVSSALGETLPRIEHLHI